MIYQIGAYFFSKKFKDSYLFLWIGPIIRQPVSFFTVSK